MLHQFTGKCYRDKVLVYGDDASVHCKLYRDKAPVHGDVASVHWKYYRDKVLVYGDEASVHCINFFYWQISGCPVVRLSSFLQAVQTRQNGLNMEMLDGYTSDT